MNKKSPPALYKEHYIDKDFERLELFCLQRDQYSVKSAVYPGSFVHVTPSFVFPITTYIEMDKRAAKFFGSPEMYDFVNRMKKYPDEPEIRFFAQDYIKPAAGEDEKYDLLISQYSGFVSRYCKRYLKIGGILLVNNSHGDASMASIDEDYIFIGAVLKTGGKYRISEKNLSEYFIPKKPVQTTPEYLEEIQRGIGYIKTASSYVFRKVK